MGHLFPPGHDRAAGFSKESFMTVWTRTVCSEKRNDPCLGLSGRGGWASPTTQALREAEPRVSLLSSVVSVSPHVEPDCPCLPSILTLCPGVPRENFSPSQAMWFSGLTSPPGLDSRASCASGHSDWARHSHSTQASQ